MDNQFLIYQTDDKKINISVRFDNDKETVWLTANQMAVLFERDEKTIRKHINNVFSENELTQNENNTQKMRVDGVKQPVAIYNLDVIISVGYRVKSLRGTQFRQWATKRLNEYIRKGFTLDDERLKNGKNTYFQELIERIRDIRASEKVFYRQILDIYATSVDYDPKSAISIDFFRKVQNKIHYAVHGQTAAEVIYHRADAEKEFMGLYSFSGERPHLKDVEVAKNYLNADELKAMGQIVEGYLAFAERQAQREEYMTMQDWATHLDHILTTTGEKLLQNAGSISHRQAIEKAHSEYRLYQARTLSGVEYDFMETIKELEHKIK